MFEVFAVHCVRTDTAKEGYGAPVLMFSNKQAADKCCKEYNTEEMWELSLMYVVRSYKVEEEFVKKS